MTRRAYTAGDVVLAPRAHVADGPAAGCPTKESDRFVLVSIGLAPVAISVRVEEDPELALLGRRSVGCEMRES